MTNELDWPLMENNITEEDCRELIKFLWPGQVPRLTHGEKVEAFESAFAQVIGTKYAVMVNSGASANLLTMQAIKILRGSDQANRVLVPCITWVSDIAAVLHAGLDPLFVDVDPYTLGMDWNKAFAKHEILAAFPTHCLGFNALPAQLHEYKSGGMVLIEDCCEALGATHGSGMLGSFGLMSNFSFYYAHHMSTIEGGMICTSDERVYETLRMLRSHGLVREMKNPMYRKAAAEAYPDLDPNFIFSHPAYNMRPTELNAVLGLSQLPRLNYNNARRTQNLVQFVGRLDPQKYRTRYRMEGSSNYALPLILQEPDAALFSAVCSTLRAHAVEFRRGTAGGGNQLRQPYAKERWGDDFHKEFPQAEHIHQFGLYIGNHSGVHEWKIEALCNALNAL